MNEIKIGNRIKLIRKKMGMTMVEFAEEIGTLHGIVSRYESNHVKPSLDKMIKISKLGNVTLEWLIFGGSTLNYGQRIKAIREKRNMTLEEFGSFCDASRGLVHGWENNKHEPNNERAIMIAKFGNIPLESLLTGVGFDERI